MARDAPARRPHDLQERGPHPAVICAALAVAVAAAFGRVGGHPFLTFDDPEYVAANARVLRGLDLDNVGWALGTIHFANWHPLTWLSYMLDVTLFGPRPGPLHLVNVALHAGAAAALFLALEALTGARWRSAAVAALFALHPTRVESVAWIAERKDVLSMLFGALTLLAYARYVRRPSGRAYALVLAAFAASLASKAMLVTLPFVLLLLDAWPLRRLGDGPGRRRAILEKLPLLGMAAAVTAVGILAQARHGAVSSLALGERLSNAAVAYPAYVWKLAWPQGLGILYPYPPEGWPAWRVAASLAAVALATAGAFALRRRAPWVTVGWCWFAGALVPVIGIVQLGAQAMADRYTYFPAVGLFVAGVFSIPAPAARLRPALAAAAVALLAVLGALTFRQAGRWASEEGLYRHTLAITGPNARLHAVLAVFLRSEGRREEAFREILEANRLWPGSAPDLVNLGVMAGETGRLDVAEKALRAAVAAAPDLPQAWWALSELLKRTNRGAEAVAALERVVALEPENGSARSDLGVALHRAGRVEEAGRAFVEAARLAPGDLEVQRNAAIWAASVGRWALAAECLARAARLRPGDPEITRRLAEARARLGGTP